MREKKLKDILHTEYINDTFIIDIESILADTEKFPCIDICNCKFSDKISKIISIEIMKHGERIIDSTKEKEDPDDWEYPFPISHYDRIEENKKRALLSEIEIPLPEYPVEERIKRLIEYTKALEIGKTYTVSHMESALSIPLVFFIMAARPEIHVDLGGQIVEFCERVFHHISYSNEIWLDIIKTTDTYIYPVNRNTFDYCKIYTKSLNKKFKLRGFEDRFTWNTIHYKLTPIPSYIGEKSLIKGELKQIWNEIVQRIISEIDEICEELTIPKRTIRTFITEGN